MSAMLAVATPAALYVMSDAAFYDEDGTLCDIASKTVALSGLQAVAAGRGVQSALSFLPGIIERVGVQSFDELRAHALELFALLDKVVDLATPGRKYELMIAGWSAERDRGEVIFHATHDQIPEGFDPVTLITHCMFVRGEALDSLFGVGLPENDWTGFDPLKHGVPAFETSRTTLTDLACGEGDPRMGYSVGGFVQSTVITADRVDTEILRVWDDRVGEKITPHSTTELAA